MESLADALRDVEQSLGEAVDRAFRSGELRGLDDAAVLSLMAQAASIARRAEAALVATSPKCRSGCMSRRTPNDRRPAMAAAR